VLKFDRNVWVLMLAGSLGMCIAPMIVFIGGIVGASLAPEASLATLPVAAIVVGTAVFVIPVSKLMQKFGRKPIFMASSLASSLSALGAAWAVSNHHFWGFIAAAVFLGGSLAVIQQYRFAAMESVPKEDTATAASVLLLGGLISALLGPELASLGKDIFEQPFVGSFCLLSIVCLMGGFCLIAYREKTVLETEEHGGGRPLSEIMSVPVFWVAVLAATIGYAVMSYIMTATPVSMHVMQAHSLEETKWVIQSHIFAMFMPSLFSGFLIKRFGPQKLMLVGLALYLVCIVLTLQGQDLMHYWAGLVVLGLGWNFLFVSGTVLLPQSYREQERFKVQGFNDFFVFGFQAFASLSSGVVIYTLGWNTLVVIALPFLLLQLGVMFIWKIKAAK